MSSNNRIQVHLLNPISTGGGGGGGGCFPPCIFLFAFNFFVLEPIVPKFGDFFLTLMQEYKTFRNLQPESCDMTIIGDWSW